MAFDNPNTLRGSSGDASPVKHDPDEPTLKTWRVVIEVVQDEDEGWGQWSARAFDGFGEWREDYRDQQFETWSAAAAHALATIFEAGHAKKLGSKWLRGGVEVERPDAQYLEWRGLGRS